MEHARARRKTFRDAPVRASIVVTKEERKKKEKKLKNKTSIKYMRGPWRGGNLPFIPCKKRKKKEEKENTRRASFTAFRDVRRHPVVSRKEKKRRDKFKK